MGLAGVFKWFYGMEFLFANGICFYRVYIIPASERALSNTIMNFYNDSQLFVT
jgi:hypothetical protein